MKQRSLISLAAAIVIAVTVAACGSSSGGGSSAAPAAGGGASVPATSSTPSSTPSNGTSATGMSIPVTLKDFSITATGASGLTPGTYTFAVSNQGPSAHNLTVNGPGVAERGDLDVRRRRHPEPDRHPQEGHLRPVLLRPRPQGRRDGHAHHRRLAGDACPRAARRPGDQRGGRAADAGRQAPDGRLRAMAYVIPQGPHRPRPPQGRRPRPGARLLPRRARLRADPALRRAGGVPLGRRLSPPHRAEHLGEPRRPPAAAGTTGLYHLAILYPTRAALADALRRVIDAGIPLDGASDHGVSEALYLRDPDGNGVELYGTGRRRRGRATPTARLAMVHAAARPRGPAREARTA